ncbi:P1 family peptidase [Kordiimonas gwangyangensis]|uniref:P1 family peptidase n=1 Tax=Kordiimonas gwangyangensis TaxID=288022 RepID=UPI00036A1AC9|nr:P1 family peptidase [Kordiimonas gwangyangensis]
MRGLTHTIGAGLSTLALAAILSISSAAVDDQQNEPMSINAESVRMLSYDWPILKVGTGSYEAGPTGVTVFQFDKKVLVAADVRGGGPGTVNAPYMDLGYNYAELDTVVFAGGSWYGLEAVTAVATALKDDGVRDGNVFTEDVNIAMSVGSIIFDFGTRRLNEIYPDKRLAQAAFRAAKTGTFPLGAYGAGRFAKSGGFFGCNAFSGQGGAFKQVGDLKVAAFVIANPYGVITDRDGKVAACYTSDKWPDGEVKTSKLMQGFPESRETGTAAVEETASAKNTTVSLIVVNQKMDPADLKRLAVQVHTSMGRGIQPFATQFDGDVLYAVSTGELEKPAFWSPDLGVIASEVMWDALLASVPEQPAAATPNPDQKYNASALKGFAGDYEFSRFASLNISTKDGKLYATASGERTVFGIAHKEATELVPVSAREFMVPGRYPLTFHFEEDGSLMLNPGHWQQHGTRK